MATLNFLGSKLQSFKDDGSVNASGTVEFFEVGGTFSTYVSSYTNSTFSVANPNVVTLDAAGRADVWLNTDADVRIKDSSGTFIDTQVNINPSTSSVSSNDNLIENPSFENDTNDDLQPDSWDVTTFTGGTAAIDTADRNHGTNSMKFVSAGNGGGTITSSSFFPVSPSTTIYSAFDLKSTADVRNLAQILWYDASQVALGSPSTDIYDDSATNPTSWTRKYQAVAVPATAYFAKFKFFGAHSSDATAGTVRIDNIAIRTVPETGHNVTVTGDITWTGTGNIEDTATIFNSSSTTKKVRIDASSVTAGQTRVLTMGDADFTLAAATQAQMEAGTANTVVVTPGRAHYHPSAAKAWVQFSQSGGTVTINQSYNVSGVTRHGVGDYTITIDTDFSNAFYVPHITARRDNANARPLLFAQGNTATHDQAAGTLRFNLWCEAAGALEDPKTCWAVFYGDL